MQFSYICRNALLMKIYFFFPAFCIPLFAFGDNPIDTSYIKIFKERFNIVGEIYSKSVEFSIKPFTKTDSIDLREIKYKPNVRSYFGISAYYKGWGGGFSVNISNSKRNDSLYGKTQYWDYRLALRWRKFGTTGYIRYYKGFYLDAPDRFDTTWNGGAYPNRGDMEFTAMGLNAYYLFNSEKFSMQAALSQSEKQKHTAGSFLLSSDFQLSLVRADSSLIPLCDEKNYYEMQGFNEMFSSSLSLTLGYARNFVLGKKKNSYICPMLFIGPGIQQKKMKVEKGYVNDNSSFFKTNFKLAFGRNASVVYYGMIFDADSNFMSAEYINFKTVVLLVDFFIGYRFG